MRAVWTFLVLLAGTPAACSTSPAAPVFDDAADARVLFIGNSLTYGHDVPALVRIIAAEYDIAVSAITIAHPDFSLEDHWGNGIAAEIRRLGADFVVMQQGPSSLPENRANLVEWAGRLSGIVREAGGEPALYMVWPDATRRFAFADVEESYAQAALAVEGRLLPVGTTWLEAWEEDADLALYASDGLHASRIGAIAAAYTITAALFDVDTSMLPVLEPLTSGQSEVLRSAVASAIERWSSSGGS